VIYISTSQYCVITVENTAIKIIYIGNVKNVILVLQMSKMDILYCMAAEG
jgi:hypothetical protein